MPNPQQVAVLILLAHLLTSLATGRTLPPHHGNPTTSTTFPATPTAPLLQTHQPSTRNKAPVSQPTRAAAPDSDAFYSNYPTLQALREKWRKLSKTSAQNVSLEAIGMSVENRSVILLRVGRTSATEPKRVLLTGLQHAREWIVPPVLTYVIEALARSQAGAEADARISGLLEDVEILVVPVMNPDGYVHSRRGERLWRKNRRIVTGSTCVGVDLNRNWGTDFGGIHSTSRNPCSDQYVGTEAFSEPETMALQKLVESTEGLLLHLDVHAYGQMVLGPWSHTDDVPENTRVVNWLGERIADRLGEPYGTDFSYSRGFVSELYPASGIMTDWTFSKGIISYTVELRPGLDAPSLEGFLLSEQEIRESCREFFGVLEVLMGFANGSEIPPDEDAGDGGDDVPVDGSGFPVVGVVGGLVGVLVVGIVLGCIVSRRTPRVRERVPSISSD